MTAMTTRIARHHLFAVLGLACAALALACLAFITPKPRIFIYFAGVGFAGLASLLFILWMK
jgi:hypothetical protein